MGIAIGATGLLLLLLFVWMLVLSVRQKRLDREKRLRDRAYHQAMERDRKREHEERVRKAEAGDITMILYLAKEEERTNLRRALHWYQKAAMQDNVIGMYGIIRISERMSEDIVLRQQAKYWRTAVAAIEGNLTAKFEAAEALFLGRGVEQNVEKAYAFMQEAANMHYLPAMLYLGDWFISENNPFPDPQLSFEWYLQATKLKSNEARMKLGLSYVQGIGVEEDFNRGCYWLERAAEKGYTPAMVQLGQLWTEAGDSGKYIAYIWLFLAAQLGDEEARVMRDKVSLTISVDTVVGLQALAKPMLKRMRENRVGKHALIKALNRLYKRDMDYLAYDLPVVKIGNEETELQQAEELKQNQTSAMSTSLDYSTSPMDRH